MKRLIVVVAALFILTGCSAATGTEPYDFQHEAFRMKQYFNDNDNIVDEDVSTLSDFLGSIDGAKYRVRGMVSDCTENENFVSGDRYLMFYLVSDIKVSVLLESGQVATDGEYIEVVGELLDIQNETIPMMKDHANFTLHNAKVVERGASVRERIEKAE
jgi:hypothetical protein